LRLGQRTVCRWTWRFEEAWTRQRHVRCRCPRGHGPQFGTLAGSRTSQKSILQCQLFMESQPTKCIASINRPLYNIPPLPGSMQFDLASPDTEKAGQTLHRPQISASTFLHKDIVQLGHKNIVRQIVVCTVHCNIPEPQLD